MRRILNILCVIILLAGGVASVVCAAPKAVPAPSKAEKTKPDAGKETRKTEDPGQSRADLLDSLFARLHQADDSATAAVIALSIRDILSRPDSPSAAVLLSQADRALKAGRIDVALDLLDLLTERYPEFAEGWYRRALARYLMEDRKGALADLDRTLALEPRHYEAWMTKGTILQELKRPREALTAFEAARTIYPALKAAQDAVRELRFKLDQQI